MIRQVDVRKEEVDKVVMTDCYRPGDYVRARITSVGDKYNYFLSSAENELGVIMAVSAGEKSRIAGWREDLSGEGEKKEGREMIPTGWTEMQCPVTLVKEKRKVAKV